MSLIFEKESYAILGACFEVYKDKGCGFLEAVYQECLALEFAMRDIPFIPQKELLFAYKKRQLQQTYKPDFICYDKIIIEIKAISTVGDVERAQVHNYLKATGFRLGLLINFGHHPLVQSERIVR